MLFASGNHTSVLSFGFTPVKPLKFTLSIDRFSMTFMVDGNGRNYLSDDLLFCVQPVILCSTQIRVFSLCHGTSSKDIFPILDIAEFKCVNTCKAAGCGPQRLERMGSLNAAIL